MQRLRETGEPPPPLERDPPAAPCHSEAARTAEAGGPSGRIAERRETDPHSEVGRADRCVDHGRCGRWVLSGESADEIQRRHLVRRRGNGHSLPPDRKSTRLNSSHVSISYAVFCLKKKN